MYVPKEQNMINFMILDSFLRNNRNLRADTLNSGVVQSVWV